MSRVAFVGLGHMGAPMAKNLLRAGFPLQVFDLNLDAVNELMHHEQTKLILATGGGAMVHAAYSSGKPAIGVGAAGKPATWRSSDYSSRAFCPTCGSSPGWTWPPRWWWYWPTKAAPPGWRTAAWPWAI